ncbi:hypothetical protein J6590_004417 [Homalodisca vitripennis]|nr:hypothetical protein J6590_004417 [Homalodisca vitripennis]
MSCKHNLCNQTETPFMLVDFFDFNLCMMQTTSSSIETTVMNVRGSGFRPALQPDVPQNEAEDTEEK